MQQYQLPDGLRSAVPRDAVELRAIAGNRHFDPAHSLRRIAAALIPGADLTDRADAQRENKRESLLRSLAAPVAAPVPLPSPGTSSLAELRTIAQSHGIMVSSALNLKTVEELLPRAVLGDNSAFQQLQVMADPEMLTPLELQR